MNRIVDRTLTDDEAVPAGPCRSGALPDPAELPESDGRPMESMTHRMQMTLLIQSLSHHWRDRDDVYVGGNQFVYFRNPTIDRDWDVLGPDVFVIDGVRGERPEFWVCWAHGASPKFVVELLSASTKRRDLTEKKAKYADYMRVPELVHWHPFLHTLHLWRLDDSKPNRQYRAVEPNGAGRLPSVEVGLELGRWVGEWEGETRTWLRLFDSTGAVVETAAEAAARERDQAARKRDHAERERDHAERERIQAERLRAEAEQGRVDAEQRVAELEARLRALESNDKR